MAYKKGENLPTKYTNNLCLYVKTRLYEEESIDNIKRVVKK